MPFFGLLPNFYRVFLSARNLQPVLHTRSLGVTLCFCFRPCLRSSALSSSPNFSSLSRVRGRPWPCVVRSWRKVRTPVTSVVSFCPVQRDSWRVFSKTKKERNFFPPRQMQSPRNRLLPLLSFKKEIRDLNFLKKFSPGWANSFFRKKSVAKLTIRMHLLRLSPCACMHAWAHGGFSSCFFNCFLRRCLL